MVSVAASYRLDDPGFVYCQGQELFSETIYTGCRTHTASCSRDTVIPFLRVKWPGHGVDQSASSGVEVKNDQSYISTPLCAFLA